jgi:hypothetical protein
MIPDTFFTNQVYQSLYSKVSYFPPGSNGGYCFCHRVANLKCDFKSCNVSISLYYFIILRLMMSDVIVESGPKDIAKMSGELC